MVFEHHIVEGVNCDQVAEFPMTITFLSDIFLKPSCFFFFYHVVQHVNKLNCGCPKETQDNHSFYIRLEIALAVGLFNI